MSQDMNAIESRRPTKCQLHRIIHDAPSIVAEAVRNGWCTAPQPMRRLTNRQIVSLRNLAKGLTCNGNARKPYRVSRMQLLLRDFLKQQELEFLSDDFHRFLDRSEYAATPETAQNFLNRMVRHGFLIRKEWKTNARSTYKKGERIIE